MSNALIYLVDEICAGVEIYYTGRTGGQYLKTSFILCDDYTELVSKLFLLTDDPAWSDHANGGFKSYHKVLSDVSTVLAKRMSPALPRVDELQGAMKARRKRRNDFFHSTSLLDLNVSPRICVESFCDLLEYGGMLLGADWQVATRAARNLESYEALLRLERMAFSDPSITPRVNRVLQGWPRNSSSSRKRGAHVAEYPEDLHLRLCVTCGGKELRDKLLSLLP